MEIYGSYTLVLRFRIQEYRQGIKQYAGHYTAFSIRLCTRDVIPTHPDSTYQICYFITITFFSLLQIK